MKKLLCSSILLMSIMLTACSNHGAVDTVKEMYTAAIEGDAETFARIHSHSNNTYARNNDNALEEYGGYAVDEGGVSNMKFAGVNKGEIQPDLLEEFNENYGDNWELVAEQRDSESFTLFLLQEIDDKYYIMEEDNYDKEEFLK